jgi:hypothetical protein
MGLDDIVYVYRRSGRNMIKDISNPLEIIQVVTTHKFNPPSITKAYMLEDGNWYNESEIEHSVQLSRDNKISKLV